MAMLGLEGYGLSDDSDSDGGSPVPKQSTEASSKPESDAASSKAVGAEKSEAEPVKVKRKLPSAMGALESAVAIPQSYAIDQDDVVDKKGTKYNSVASPASTFEVKNHDYIKTQVVGMSKDKKYQGEKTYALPGKGGGAKAGRGALLPPQLRKPNKVTEDTGAWNTDSRHKRARQDP